MVLAAILALPACTERISELDPRPGLSNLFFRTHLEGREPPPGLDGEWPNLSSVPPRPEPPSAETRQGLSADLAADRARSRTPLEPTGGGRFPPGDAAPPPPRLAAVPPIRLEPEAPSAPAPAALPVPATPAAPQRAPEPGAAPPALPPASAPRAPEPTAAPPPGPAPELLAPVVPPPPTPDLLAPPPPPSRDLLAPRGG